ncbi:5-formyltetrahydrofolate cyclo-ligase [Lachnospiraceae bacterium]|nr:5-formyltetrahydrofolate cyclo-ligase [Lachnospiraceae bacterium]
MQSDAELIKVQKKALRRKILSIRNSLSSDEICEKSESIETSLFELNIWKKAEKIFFFYGYSTEVKTDFMILHALSMGKRIFIPRVMSDTEMKFYEINDLNGLVPDRHGIPEPLASWKSTYEKPDLIIIPGVAFDGERHRMGYGMGYYDRFLSGLGGVPNAALAFELQIVENVPHGALDLPVDMVITEERIIGY